MSDRPSQPAAPPARSLDASTTHETIAPTAVGVDDTIAPTAVGVDDTIAPTAVGVDDTIAPTAFGVDEMIAPTAFGIDEMSAPTAFGVDETVAASAPNGREPRPLTLAPFRHADSLLDHIPFRSRYDYRKQLGAGGMGEVRLMSDLQTGRDVAMKLILASKQGVSEVRERFVREARVQAQLEHPSIVPVYDLGMTPDGVEYFTMKRIGGRTLRDIITKLVANDRDTITSFPRNRLLGAFRQACLAIEYAHRRGILHRDIKPDNLMLGEFGEVYVLDWGLAKIRDLDADPDANNAPPISGARHSDVDKTIAGSIFGTLGYMAPEQAVGELHLDDAADVYSLGAVLFEFLTLERLLTGNTAPALLKASIEGPRDLGRRLVEYDVPPELAALVEAATRTAPSERMASARDLAEGIQRFLDGDRDGQARTRLAELHAQAAEEAEARAKQSDAIADRQLALQEAGRALVLDPSSLRAATTMMSILVQSPKELPDEVVRVVDREEAEETRLLAQQGAGLYMINAAVALLAAWLLGLLSIAWLLVIIIPQLSVSFLCWMIGRRTAVPSWTVIITGALAFTAIAGDAGIAGPLMLVPGYAASQVIVLSTARHHPYRHILLGMACASVLIPLGLEYTGWLQPAYEFVDGRIVVHPRFVELPALALPLGVITAIVTSVIGPALITWKQVSGLREMRRRVHLQSWTLRQLVPEHTTLENAAPPQPR